ncbi:hypothetical protein SK224_08145 [Microbacterium sp. BG28]|uniref:hypothetical protein n=1 Tax=Microbacterium sp. BG28 TaxID=3097356 RepID=UPI002A5A1E5A|nr:hypothetical protein [Microbacterium sp. BG28]MDY0829098.1 hypothetical protein [Microbacterium sp. BG28]
MSKQTDLHRRAFALRDDLADVLEQIVRADARISFDIIVPDEGFVFADMAEQLIQEGWVDSYPDTEGSGS